MDNPTLKTRPLSDRHIIYPDELNNYGRPIGKVDENKLLTYIIEVEQMYVKKVLGESLFLKLLQFNNDDKKLEVLLEGGTYNSNGCICSDSNDNGNFFTISGLKVAVAYFVYAQNIMSGDFQSTRYGMVLKDGDYSSHISSKERSDAYNNALEVAHFYLSECANYCKSVGLLKRKGNPSSIGSLTIRKIGR